MCVTRVTLKSSALEWSDQSSQRDVTRVCVCSAGVQFLNVFFIFVMFVVAVNLVVVIY